MLTIQEGNIPDVIHFETIFRQCIPYVSKKAYLYMIMVGILKKSQSSFGSKYAFAYSEKN